MPEPELKRVKVSSLRPNPHRHYKTYKIVREKVNTLKESIAAEGFWSGQITARPGSGGYEIAWGHHRWKAAQEQLGENAYIRIIVEDMSDDSMLRRMARENNEVYDANAQQDIELVKAAIEGYAAGTIHLPKPASRNALKAEDYVNCESIHSLKFTRDGLANYLGYTGRQKWRIEQALGHLKLVKEDYLDIDDYADLSPKQALDLKTEVHRAQSAGKDVTKKVAQKVGKAVREKSAATNKGRTSGSSKKTIREVAQEVVDEETGRNTELHKFHRKFTNTRDSINAARLSLRSLTDEMVYKGVTHLSGPEATAMLQAIADMRESISYFEHHFGRSKLRAIK